MYRCGVGFGKSHHFRDHFLACRSFQDQSRSWANGKMSMIRHGRVLLGEDKRTDYLAGITRNLIDLEIANNHRMV